MSKAANTAARKHGLFHWTRDGDQWVAKGGLGEYRITEWGSASGSSFLVTFKPRSGSKKAIGDMVSLQNAKLWAMQYDGYRSVAA